MPDPLDALYWVGNNIEIFVIAGIFIVGRMVQRARASSQEPVYRARLEQHFDAMGFDLLGVELRLDERYDRMHYGARVRHREDGELYEAGGRFMGDEIELRWGEDDPFHKPKTLEDIEARERERAQQRSPAERREARIRQEVAARLDRITADPELMMRYDLDGSGHIDGQEWEQVRRMVRQEVERELPPSQASSPPPSPRSDDQGPEGPTW